MKAPGIWFDNTTNKKRDGEAEVPEVGTWQTTEETSDGPRIERSLGQA